MFGDPDAHGSPSALINRRVCDWLNLAEALPFLCVRVLPCHQHPAAQDQMCLIYGVAEPAAKRPLGVLSIISRRWSHECNQTPTPPFIPAITPLFLQFLSGFKPALP